MKLVKIDWGSDEGRVVENRNTSCSPDNKDCGVSFGEKYSVLEHYYDSEGFLNSHYYLIENDSGEEVIVESSKFDKVA